MVGEWKSLATAYAGLLATHYVFNLRYPKKQTKTMTFMQKFVCKLEDDLKTPEAVLNFWSKFN